MGGSGRVLTVYFCTNRVGTLKRMNSPPPWRPDHGQGRHRRGERTVHRGLGAPARERRGTGRGSGAAPEGGRGDRVGKSSCSDMSGSMETDNPISGLTRNPWRLDRSAGSSSGGEGAIIAAGGAPLGLGAPIGPTRSLCAPTPDGVTRALRPCPRARQVNAAPEAGPQRARPRPRRCPIAAEQSAPPEAATATDPLG